MVLDFIHTLNELFIKKTPITEKTSLQDLWFFRSPDVTWQEIDQCIHLLHKMKGEIDILNDSGSLVWRALVEKRQTFNSLMQLLSKKYHINKSRLKKDLISFLKKYTNEGYIFFTEKSLS